MGNQDRKILPEAELSQQIDTTSLSLSDVAKRTLSQPISERSSEDSAVLNRQILEAGFTGTILREDVHQPYYYAMRAGYSYIYSLITWLLIFGCIGFSQSYFHTESRLCRYFSDASYWFYLAHLPIQFQILMWIGDEPWHWTFKFLIYVVGTTAVLLPSYHYLVRPTWVGWLLNGRKISIAAQRVDLKPNLIEAQPSATLVQ